MIFLLPERLDLDKLFIEHPPSTRKGGRKFKKDELLFIIYLLCYLPIQNPSLLTEDGYITLSSTLLNRWITNYKDYINYLIEAGIVESDEPSGF